MALLIILIGIIAVDVGVRGTYDQLATLLASDGPPFLKWFAAIVFVGALGYAEPLRPASRLLLTLIFLDLFIVNRNSVFSQAQQAFTTAPTPTAAEPLVSQADAAALQQGPTVTVNVAGGGGKASPQASNSSASPLAAASSIAQIATLFA